MQSTLQKLNSSFYDLRGRACEFATCAFRDWLQLTYHFPDRCRGVQISLHDRRLMSQAGRTRYFARSATRGRSAIRGEDKNKALSFSSPRLALRARVALRAKYRVRPAWLIKRLRPNKVLLLIDQNPETSSFNPPPPPTKKYLKSVFIPF